MKGNQIIRNVMAEYKIGKVDFYFSRYPEHVAARRAAIVRLHAEGFDSHKIGRLMDISPATARYWINPEYRISSNAARLRRYHKARAS